MSSPAENCCCEHRLSNESGFSTCTLTPPAPESGNGPQRTKTKILFVDDERAMIRVLKMGMRPMAAEWDLHFAESGEEGLALVNQQSFDVVVTDMRMSGINGAQLLNHVLRHQPQTVRIILSGYADLSEVVNCVGLTHQFLTKPCSLDDLKNCLKRVTGIKHQLGHEKLRELTGGMASLPSLPELYLEIADALQSPTTSAERIAEIASKDPAMSAKLLQLSNSAFFGFSRKIFSVTEAVQLLGVGVIQSLSLAVPLFTNFDRDKCPDFSIEGVWQHSIATATLARQLYHRQLDDSHRAEQAFAAGILHDVGKIILADKLPEQYGAIIRESQAMRQPIFQVERRHLEATHAEVGAYLLALWGLPVPLVEAVACHHQPQRCCTRELCVAGVIHLADALQHAQAPGPKDSASLVDADYLKQMNLSEEFDQWLADLKNGSAQSGG